MHDVQTSHITVGGADMERKVFTTGFTPTLSHTRGLTKQRFMQAKRHALEVMAVLVSEGDNVYTAQDIIEHVDFFMSYRASENDVVLDHLEIERHQCLKCCSDQGCIPSKQNKQKGTRFGDQMHVNDPQNMHLSHCFALVGFSPAHRK